MKAIVYNSEWDIKLEERPVPIITKSNQVLVKIKATGICGTDLGIISGKYQASTSVILGHESAGEVFQVGEEVSNLKIGDRVVIDPTYYCGNCNMCRTGRQNHCEYKGVTETGVSSDGTFTDFYVTEERFLYKLADHVTYEEATMTEPLSCVLTGINQVKFLPNYRTIVLGSGPMGMLYAHALASKGILGAIVEISDARLDYASNIAPVGWTLHKYIDEAVNQLSPKEKLVDFIVDTTGVMATKSINVLQKGGSLLLVGLRDGEATFNPKYIVDRSITILGSIDSLGTFSTAHYMIEKQIIPTKKLISHVLPLENFNEALAVLGLDIENKQLLSSAKAMKVIIQ
ncbi:zinc-dependent alcohol dehydrogenase [Bacillus cereus]